MTPDDYGHSEACDALFKRYLSEHMEEINEASTHAELKYGEDYSPGDMAEINERFVNEFYHWALRQPGVPDEGRAYLQRMAALTDALRQKN